MIHLKSYQNFAKQIRKFSQTSVNDHLRITTTCLGRPLFWGPNFNFYNIRLALNNDHLPTTTTCQQRPPVNNGHKFWVPRVDVIHKFDFYTKWYMHIYFHLQFFMPAIFGKHCVVLNRIWIRSNVIELDFNRTSGKSEILIRPRNQFWRPFSSFLKLVLQNFSSYFMFSSHFYLTLKLRYFLKKV